MASAVDLWSFDALWDFASPTKTIAPRRPGAPLSPPPPLPTPGQAEEPLSAPARAGIAAAGPWRAAASREATPLRVMAATSREEAV